MERESGLVSVIIPCYNHGECVKGAIENILKQTYRNFEIIVVDDGSDDKNTVKTLNQLKKNDVKVYFKKNGGVSSARNYAINKSKGEYILTLDADDRFHPTFVEKAVKVLKHNHEIGMVTSNLIRINSEDKHTKVTIKGGGIKTYLKNHEANASLLYRHKCWNDAKGYDENMEGFEDWDFIVGVTKKGWEVYSIPEHLFYYDNTNNDSLYDKVIHKRPEFIKYMAKKHQSEYKKYMEHVVYDREIKIKEMKKTIEIYKNSFSYRIGKLVLKPFRWLKKLAVQPNSEVGYSKF